MRYFIIAFAASVAGAISGVGGGVIIKPVMDLVGRHSITTINLLSSFTVLSMALAAIIRHLWYHTRFAKKKAVLLGLGAVAGGYLGDGLFEVLLQKAKHTQNVKQLQNLLLFLLLVFVFIYMNWWRERVQFKIQRKTVILLTGLALGICSAFLGIGGGPINIAVLSLFFSMNPKEASVNSLILIVFSQTAKLLTALSGGSLQAVDLTPLWMMVPAGIVGGLIGSIWNRKMKSKQIMRVFNGILLFVIAITITNIIFP